MTKSLLETDIFNYHTPEFFINMKSIPDKTSSERKPFVLEEKRKCRDGININGIYIPGNLYFHLNYYKLQGDDKEYRGKKSIFLPTLRDNEWIIFNDYDKAEKEGKIYILFGLRQSGKTEDETSLCLRELSLFDNTEALALFANTPYRDNFVKKIRVAIEHGEKFIIRPNIDKDWSKEEIRFGITKQDNTVDIRATLFIYNTQEGKKIQVGSGKALKHGSKVYYEDRLGNIEDCKVGDKIYGRDGKLTTVLGVYPQGVVDLYEIELFDGRKVTCSGDHLWTVKRTDKLNFTETISTEKLFNSYKREYFNKKLNKKVFVNRYSIPDIECVEYSERDVLINPYYLGIWLGDGTTENPSHITTIEPEIVSFLEEYSNSLGGRLLKKDLITYKISNKIDGNHSPVKKLFKAYNLKGNKHIPNDYLFNSKEVRLELLRGLMDTDGYVDKNGKLSISLSNKTLADNVLQLIRSLGINCTMTEKKTSYFNGKYGKKLNGKTANVIYIGSCDLELFKLSRKKERQILRKRPHIGIENIKKVSPDYATCIAVDNKDSLFLTNDFIPTHNTPSFFLIDEAGASPFRSVYDTVEPALLTDSGGLRCSPIFTLTGGEVEKVKDAEDFIKNPSESKQFCTILDDGRTVGGRFLSGLYRKDCKKPTTISEYTGIKTNSWLDDYPMMVSDFDLAKRKIDEEIADAQKSPNKQTVLLKRIFFPQTIEDVFLSPSNNNFPIEEITQWQDWLKTEYQPNIVDLFVNPTTGKIETKFSDKGIITEFPVKPTSLKEAGVVIYEHPIAGLPFGTYVAGLDLYNQNESSDRVNSLGSIYIYKRMYDPLGQYQNSIVASFSARPNLKEFKEIVMLLIKYYNAATLVELTNTEAVDWFIERGMGPYFMEGLGIAKEVNPFLTSGHGMKGIKPTPGVQKHYMNIMVDYTKEIIGSSRNPDGSSKEIMGLTRINDIMLLEEMKKYKSKESTSKGVHDGNFDRIIAFGHAIMLAKHLDKVQPLGTLRFENDDENEIRRNVILHSPFQMQKRSKSKTSGNRILNSPFIRL